MTGRWITLFALSLLGCSSLRGKAEYPHLTLGPVGDFESSRPFRQALHSEPGRPNYERARINYLLERVSNSPYNFIRNGKRYSARRAGAHLRWKYYFRSGRDVKSAEEFITRVAAGSKRSGQPYLIEVPGAGRYPVKAILVSELSQLDRELEERRIAEALAKAAASPEMEPTAETAS